MAHLVKRLIDYRTFGIALLNDETQLLDSDHMLIEGNPHRRRVAYRVVEQPHVERVDGRVDEKMIAGTTGQGTAQAK